MLLTIEFDAIQEEFGLERMDLMSSFSGKDLSLHAQHVLLGELLREVQKYAVGENLYIPKIEERRKWGEGSGARTYYKERNEKILSAYQRGNAYEILAGEFGLSVDSIRRIIYQGNE